MKLLRFSIGINNKFYFFILFNLLFLFFNSFPAISSKEDDELKNLFKRLGSMSIAEGKAAPRKKIPSTPKGKEIQVNTPQSEPKVSRKYEFDVDLLRYTNEKKAGIYFSKTAELKCSGVAISSTEDTSIFGENSHLKSMDDFLIYQVENCGESGWKRNHLTASLFVIVEDTQLEISRCIEGSLLAEENGEEGTVEDRNIFYDFSISPKDKNLNSRKFADFASSSVPESVSEFVKNRNYLPITQSTLRPILDNNNHGDRLALDTIQTNIDLFFSLIKKSAHREDLPIRGMGVKYNSSYDACDECFQKIYDLRDNINEKLVSYATDMRYQIKDDNRFPFYSLFYSTRPYKKSGYTVSWRYSENNEYRCTTPLKPAYTFPRGKGIVYHPTYYFNLPKWEKPHDRYFSKRSSKNLNILRESTEIDSNFIYSYVKSFEPDNLPISYHYGPPATNPPKFRSSIK